MAATVAAAALVLVVSACATVPDSGSVQRGTGPAASAAGQEYLLQPETVRPCPCWGPAQVVSAFLDATASFAGDYAAARQYLAPGTRWHPNGFAAVVIGPQTKVAMVQPQVQPQQRTQPISTTTASVKVSGPQLATVGSDGQYRASPAGERYTRTVQLKHIRGRWRITSSPPSMPPLYESDFGRVYLPRELYFVAGDGKSLVPDPVFVPLQATAVDVARDLVTSLQHGPQGWLSGATSTALAGAQRPAAVTTSDGTATVNLTVAGKLNAGRIMAQLLWTLASPSFTQPGLVQSVVLKINGSRQRLASWSGGRPEQQGASLLSVPVIAPHQPLYSVAGDGVIERLAARTLSAARISVHAGNGRTPLGAIAVSPGGRYVAWAAKSGQAVYYGPLRPGARLTEWAPSGGVTSVSWAANGSLWVVVGGVVWMIQPGHQPTLLSGAPQGTVTSVQVAPDNVRAAMIVKGRGGTHLVLGAIQYFPTGAALGPVSMGPTVSIATDVPDPVQVAWYDPDDLIVLSKSQTGLLPQEVPVNGGSPTPLPYASGTQSISSAGPANPLAAGLTHGGLALSYGLNGTPVTTKNAGLHPTYAAG